jgi:hypothetical protein
MMDDDLERMSREQLIAEVKTLRVVSTATAQLCFAGPYSCDRGFHDDDCRRLFMDLAVSRVSLFNGTDLRRRLCCCVAICGDGDRHWR